LERVCDHIVLLVASKVQLAGDVDEMLTAHHRLTGPLRSADSLPGDQSVIEESHTDKQSTFLVHTEQPILDPAWTVANVNLEDVVLGYMGRARETRPTARRAELAVAR
ncbi:MAG: transporter related protein, partial [Acidimicrobiales bacterium]|nr:transporter related protein [Acidimicrobiales bacterium]